MSATFRTLGFAGGCFTSLPCKPSTPSPQGLSSLHRSKKMLPCNHLSPRFNFHLIPVLLNALFCTYPRFKNRQMPCLMLRRVGREYFVTIILRNSYRYQNRSPFQPALKITPVGLLTFLSSLFFLCTLGICSFFAMSTVHFP
jgi:hypothetical protein